MTTVDHDLEMSTLRIVLDRQSIDVRELNGFMTALDTVAIGASLIMEAAGGRLEFGVPDEGMPGGLVYMPNVRSVRNESPVTVFLEALDVPAFVALAAFLIRRPAYLRTFLMRYRIDKALAEERVQAVEYWRNQIQRMQANGVDVRELPDPPEWLREQS